MTNLLIKKPIISEKSFNLAANGVYTFRVSLAADKKQVAREVETIFKVDVISVNIVNIPGKVKRAGKKFGRRSDIKKALVKIKSGQKIAIFEVEDDKKEKSLKPKKENHQEVKVAKSDKEKVISKDQDAS